MKKLVFLLSMFTLVLFGCVSASDYELNKNEDNLYEIDIQIDGAATPYYAPFYLAEERGYFEEQGINVNFYYASASEIVKNVGANNIHFGFPNADPVIIGYANEVPVKVVHNTYQQGLGAVIFKEDSGIESPADLKGKTIGITSFGSPNYIQLQVLLQQQGLSINDVNIEIIGTGAIVNALVSDQVDAITFSKLRTYELLASGVAVDQFVISDFMPSYGNILITNPIFLEEHPEIVEGFIVALNQAIDDIVNGEVEEAVAIARDNYTPSIAGKEETYIEIINNEFIPNLWTSEYTEEFGYGYSNLEDYQEYVDILVEHGLISESYDAENLIENVVIHNE